MADEHPKTIRKKSLQRNFDGEFEEVEVEYDDFQLDRKKPLVLLLGGITHEGIVSALSAAGRQYKQKFPESSIENWRTILYLFGRFKVLDVLWKLGPRAYLFLHDPAYKRVCAQLFSDIAKRRHVIFVHQQLLTGKVDQLIYPTLTPTIVGEVNELLEAHKLNVLPYSKNAELTVLALEFIAQTEQGLLLRVYVPSGRMWSNETDRLLQMFRDYLARVSKLKIRLDQTRTDRGVIYEFHGDSELAQGNLGEEFEQFSNFVDLCVTDPDQARNILSSKDVPTREISEILTRYAKEAKRLQVDLKQERESKLLNIRHRLESELVDAVPSSTLGETVDSLVNSIVPPIKGISSAIQVDQNPLQITDRTNLTINVKPQIVHAVSSIVAQEIRGDAHLTDSDQELLALIQKYEQRDATQLASAVHELGDTSAPKPGRLLAKQRLTKFLIGASSKIGDVAAGVLQSYIEKQMGL